MILEGKLPSFYLSRPNEMSSLSTCKLTDHYLVLREKEDLFAAAGD